MDGGPTRRVPQLGGWRLGYASLRPWVRAKVGGLSALTLLFALDFLGLRLDFMGFSDEKAVSRVLREYGPDVVRGQLALLAVMMIAGALLGLLGAAVFRVRALARAAADGAPAEIAYPWLVGFCAALVGHALLLGRHLVTYPQLYSEAFYERGGARRRLMLALTRHAPPWLFLVVAIALVAALLPHRFVAAWVREQARSIAAAATWLRGERRAQLAAAMVLVIACGGLLARRWARHSAPAPRPNILLVAVDSLRADRVFGPLASRFPTIAALAAKSVRFREAHVTVPRTFPSFVTLLTGRFPHHHGIRHMFPSQAERERIGPSLPRALADDGFRTSVLSDYAGEIFARTPIGFRDVDAPRFDMHTIVALRGLEVHPNALPYAAGVAEAFFPFVRAMPERADPALLADRAVSTLDRLAAERQPFFLTLFFSTPHFPYAAPYPWYKRFVDPRYEGVFLYDKPPLAPDAVTPGDATHIQGLYDGAVGAVDAALARVLAELARAGVADDTIVVLLADHGENLWEDPRAGMGHGDHLIGDRADHVPLLVYDPRARGSRDGSRDIWAIVRDVDLAPTLAALVGVKTPPGDGVDLGPLLRGERADLGLAAYAETEYWFVPTGPGFDVDERLPYPAVTGATELAADGDVYMRPEIEPLVIAAKHRAIRLGDWKLTYRPTRAGVGIALFDTAHDPEERHDLSAREPDRVALLRERLYAWMLSDPGVVLRGDFVVPR